MDLKLSLQTLTANHTELSYRDLWQAFQDLDLEIASIEWDEGDQDQCKVGKLVDMYSSICWTPLKRKCGNYHSEGDCYNREHSWPKSLWGGFSKGFGAQTDLFHLFPVDGWVNGKRWHYPFGNVDGDDARVVSSDGAKLGSSSSCNGCTVFEPSDVWKGDFARGHFYLSVTYMNVWQCCDTPGTNKWDIKPWLEETLKQWHKLDPVSDKERHRNEFIHKKWQHNRNPFIDHPELVDQISDF
eukprot:TRINITY_DN1469_c0_g1_i1.p1 TRINITY_DN1469_c0_g1~~TRINITY_DN1469_c0_g1_i1.p1  ORF type:complete len:280 (+),score=72.14 TRINITY_DN1469_c0_g1_i1:120-842(+)